MPQQAERAPRVCEALIERARYPQGITHPIGVAFDDWNVWYSTRGPELRQRGIEERYDLSDALAIATFLTAFIRHCRSVEIANFAQMVNAIAAIFTNTEGLFLQTAYQPLRLYASGRELCLAVVNRSPDDDITTRIDHGTYSLAGELAAYEVNGQEPATRKSFEQPSSVQVQTRRLQFVTEYTFPTHSVTLLRGQLS